MLELFPSRAFSPGGVTCISTVSPCWRLRPRCCGAAAAQAATSVHDQYRADRAACAGEPADSRAACIREAGAAAQAARQGGLSSANASTYENNALARCDVFKAPEDKSDCIARMGNKATVQGSVDGGGLLRRIGQDLHGRTMTHGRAGGHASAARMASMTAL
ncbi:hypothetical protein ALISP_0948 [Alicycliphilus sp. B1]|nr:hypothetical protein ALISP_0948 [Alicycliphilus sp. B1]